MLVHHVVKKFNLELKTLNNKILTKIMVNMLNKGEYSLINNIIEYTHNIELELQNCIRNEYTNNISNLKYLKELSTEIKMLINHYKLLYLEEIYKEIYDTIILINIKYREKELKDKQRSDELKAIEVIKRKEQEIKEKQRIEDNKLCICGIKIKNICSCKKSFYDICDENH